MDHLRSELGGYRAGLAIDTEIHMKEHHPIITSHRQSLMNKLLNRPAPTRVLIKTVKTDPHRDTTSSQSNGTLPGQFIISAKLRIRSQR